MLATEQAGGSGDALPKFPRCRALDLEKQTWQSIEATAELDLQHLHHVLGVCRPLCTPIPK
jgi:hypothetical protein